MRTSIQLEKRDVQPSKGASARPIPGKRPLWDKGPPPEKQGPPIGPVSPKKSHWAWLGQWIVFGFGVFSQSDLESFRDQRAERFKEHNKFRF
jgi:hypothetical protein